MVGEYFGPFTLNLIMGQDPWVRLATTIGEHTFIAQAYSLTLEITIFDIAFRGTNTFGPTNHYQYSMQLEVFRFEK